MKTDEDRFRLFQFDCDDMVAMMQGRYRFDPAVLPPDATIVRVNFRTDYNPPIFQLVVASESFPVVRRGHPIPLADAGFPVSDGGDPPTVTVPPANGGTVPWLAFPEYYR